jgi:ribosome-associated protein
MSNSIDKLLVTLEDIKASNITTINVEELTSYTDYIVIATARSSRHAEAISEHLKLENKELINGNSITGKQQSEWIVVDCKDVVIHVMTEQMREFYQLEKIWLK